jgi:hypothetical protein
MKGELLSANAGKVQHCGDDEGKNATMDEKTHFRGAGCSVNFLMNIHASEHRA